MSRKLIVIVAFIAVIACLCIYLVESFSSPKDPQKYLATSFVFRHGQKTAAGKINSIPCAICEDIGYAQLTRNGSLQLYNQGLFLRKKYFRLFSPDGRYRESDMRVLCSAGSRTSMSLQSFMTGFLSAPQYYEDNLPKDWQPFNYDLDYKGNYIHPRLDWDHCPKYSVQLNQSLQQPPLGTIMAQDREMLDTLSSLFETPINGIFDLLYMIDAIDIFQTLANDTLPQWASDLYDTKLHVYLRHFFHHMLNGEDMIRYRSGLVLTEIVKNYQNIAQNKSGKKFAIYSGHDLTVYSIAAGLGVTKMLPMRVLHGETIMIDLVDTGKDEPEVQVDYLSYQNGKYARTTFKVVDGKDSVPLSEFAEHVEDLMVTEKQLDEYCASS